MFGSFKAALAVGVAFSVMVIGAPDAAAAFATPCYSDADCNLGEYCGDAGTCVSGSVPTCWTDIECSPGAYCVGASVDAHGTCRSGSAQQCYSDTGVDCPSGESCVGYDGYNNGTCVSAATCTSNSGCLPGSVCSNGTCCDPTFQTCASVICAIDDPVCDDGPNEPSSNLTVDGFLQPIGAALVNDYRDLLLPTHAVRAARHVLPLRFALYDELLAELTDVELAAALRPAPMLWSIHLWNGFGVPSASTEVESVGAAHTGTSFRYTGTWTYNLDTASTGMVRGSTYLITVLMPDDTFWYTLVAVH